LWAAASQPEQASLLQLPAAAAVTQTGMTLLTTTAAEVNIIKLLSALLCFHLQEDTQDLLATVAAASQAQQQQQQEQQQQPEQLHTQQVQQHQQQQQQQQQFTGTSSSPVEQATAWQDEAGDDETEAGLPEGLQLVSLCVPLTCFQPHVCCITY
jgi:hypothetical protein